MALPRPIDRRRFLQQAALAALAGKFRRVVVRANAPELSYAVSLA